MANHAPSVYHWSRPALVVFYVTYLLAYWVWDTTNSQKNRFRQEERGTLVERKTFPQLPWQTVKNPKVIKTQAGESILADGWCIFLFQPMIPHYPKARFPGVVVFSEIYQGAPTPRYFSAN
ncbi:MAG: hypothetical protein Q9207_002219 [Kuettlingeria erythrocarpa]